jgi:arginyl-tRNA synthetase
MLQFNQKIKMDVQAAIKSLYQLDIDTKEILINTTKPEFEGDYTLVTFALAKQLKQKPDVIAQAIGEQLASQPAYHSFNIIQGFLNLVLDEKLIIDFLKTRVVEGISTASATGQKVMIEYSSPNTNKPLHFGHMRNIFLGASMSNILAANGDSVIKSNLLNDRGIHICKSMHQWMQHGNGATPESTSIKGDHLVGDYYVSFENTMKQQAQVLLAEILENNLSNIDMATHDHVKKLLQAFNEASELEKKSEIKAKLSDIARANTAYMKGARELLIKWENQDAETKKIWRMMNDWVIAGFENTYKKMGITFDKLYFESETYLLGKQIVEEGVTKNVLFKKEDGSIWIDLTADGLDEKLLLRGDGTSVYITQDIGTAQLKFNDYNGLDKSVYVIADEQNYHMQVLKLILEKLEEPCAKGIHHLSYGLVELPSGRMKTREGTVVDADDIMQEMIDVATKQTNELGKVEGFTAEELQKLYHTLGLGALKFFLLRVDPKKRMIFNPEESIDFQGFTGPFIQYTYARTCAILRKQAHDVTFIPTQTLLPAEKNILITLEQLSGIINQASIEYSPSVVCNYVFSLAKQFNGFLAEYKVLIAETEDKKQLRLQLCYNVKETIKYCLSLLGIDAPEKM